MAWFNGTLGQTAGFPDTEISLCKRKSGTIVFSNDPICDNAVWLNDMVDNYSSMLSSQSAHEVEDFTKSILSIAETSDSEYLSDVPSSTNDQQHEFSMDPLYNEFFGTRRRKQGLHGNQDLEKARQARLQKWSRSSEGEGQAASLILFLREQNAKGTIKLWIDESIAPHGVAGFEVKDLATFKSRRTAWFQRKHVGREVGYAEQANSKVRRESNSVNQAFRRNGLVPQRKPGSRGVDWDGGRLWSFDAETFSKYGARTKLKGLVEPGSPGAAAAAEPAMEDAFVCFISKELMTDPVIVPETGISYERSSIEAWLQQSMTDPMTGAALSSRLLIRNVALAECIAIHRASLADSDQPRPAGGL